MALLEAIGHVPDRRCQPVGVEAGGDATFLNVGNVVSIGGGVVGNRAPSNDDSPNTGKGWDRLSSQNAV